MPAMSSIEPAIREGIRINGRVLSLEFFAPVTREVLGQRDVRHRNVEPVALLELQVSQEEITVAFLIQDRDLHGVHTGRQDGFRDEGEYLISFR